METDKQTPETEQQNKRNEPGTRSLKMSVSAVNVDERTVELAFSSEEPVLRWGDNEILQHDPECIDFSRITSGVAPVLYNHNRDQVIGKIEKAWLDTDRKCRAIVKFDDDEESMSILRKLDSGSIKGVSFGYRVTNWEYVDDGETSTNGRFLGPCYVGVRWEILEISIATIPADPTVGIGRSLETPAVEEPAAAPEETRSDSVDKDKQTPAAPVIDAAQVRAEALEQERKRIADITNLCREFDEDPQEFITAGRSVEEVTTSLLRAQAEQRKAQKQASATVTMDEADKFRAAVTDGLSMRCMMAVDKPADGAQQFRGAKLMDIARECYERSTGKRASYDDPMTLVRDAITGSSDFPLILSNIAKKSMAQAYATANTTYEQWTRKGSLSDFKTTTRLRLSEADELLPLSELGEFKHAEITEGSQTVKLGTYGRKWSISRQAIINDDLGALTSIPSKYSSAAKRMINRMCYAILTGNPVMTEDGKTLFHASHNNIGTAAPIGAAAFTEALTNMRRQKNIGGKEWLNLKPEFLLIPPELAFVAAQFLQTSVDPTKNNAVPNVFQGIFTPISDPELTDPKAWYLAASPSMIDTVEVNYLNGQETPMMESRVGFDVDGMEYRIRLDVGVSAMDWRGFFKNEGA